MKDDIKLLLSLQERDLELDRLQNELASVPGRVAGLKGEIQAEKTALESAKKELNQFQLTKKQKELDLDVQETAIRKHSTDLNAIKTNEAYKALLGEIDKAKQVKSSLEDQILQLMEQIDQATKVWKQKEADSQGHETTLQQQILEWEARGKELEKTIAAKQAERAQALASLAKPLAHQYSTLRNGKRGATVVPILKGQCSGCHMKVSQNLIVELRRGHKIVSCESCSRIVYLEEVPAA